jgi:transglutaminase-like putative cysteine protease
MTPPFRGKGIPVPIVVLLVVLAIGLPRAALAANPFPDWVTQAAAAKLPSYPPNTPAVVVLDDRLITVTPDGQTVERKRWAVRILRPTGREYARIVAAYSKDEKLDSFHAWSIGPDGHPYTVKDQEVHDEALGEWGILYDDLRAKAVTPPAGDPGAIIAFEVQRHVATYGADEQTWDFQGEIPALHSVLELDLPATWYQSAAWLHHAPVTATEISANHWRWQLDGVPAIDLTDVPLAPSPRALAARMVIRYAASQLPTGDQRWTQIGNWYDTLASNRTEAPQEIAAKSREVAPGTDFKTRIEGVAAFMQTQIRYVGIEIGIGGLQPHPAVDVFKYRYGDCKDKATLMIAMLNAVGVRATWVLVDTHRGFIDPSLPSVRGNHAIVAIQVPAGDIDPALHAVVTTRTGARYLIFDPTDTYTPIGLLSFALQGGYGILVAGNDSQVFQLPILAPNADMLERTASFSLTQEGTLKGTVTETRSGEAAHRYRRLYTEEGQKQQHEDLERRLQKDFSSFTVEGEDSQNAREMSRNLVLQFTLTASGYAQSTGNLLLIRPRVLGRNSRYYNDKPRSYPIDLGETGTWRDSIDVALPAGYIVDDLPAPVDLDVGFAHYKSNVKADGNMLHYSREYVVSQLDLSPEKSADVSKLMGVISADENSSAVLKKQ